MFKCMYDFMFCIGLLMCLRIYVSVCICASMRLFFPPYASVMSNTPVCAWAGGASFHADLYILLSVYLSLCLYLCLSMCLSISLSVGLPLFSSVSLFICLPVHRIEFIVVLRLNKSCK